MVDNSVSPQAEKLSVYAAFRHLDCPSGAISGDSSSNLPGTIAQIGRSTTACGYGNHISRVQENIRLHCGVVAPGEGHSIRQECQRVGVSFSYCHSFARSNLQGLSLPNPL